MSAVQILMMYILRLSLTEVIILAVVIILNNFQWIHVGNIKKKSLEKNMDLDLPDSHEKIVSKKQKLWITDSALTTTKK